ncbi:MAG: hypothetical protein WCU88_00580 [Elusimicrobiota bacterium]|jgi:hypothetical protein
MPIKKKAAKPAKKSVRSSTKKVQVKDADPEWEHLEERFSTLSSDFSELVEMMDRDDQKER